MEERAELPRLEKGQTVQFRICKGSRARFNPSPPHTIIQL